MKCQLEPSSEIVKLEYKDWPLLFKVCNIKFNSFYDFKVISNTVDST